MSTKRLSTAENAIAIARASKNGEPVIPSRPENLLCYQSKSKGGLNPAPNAFLANQFGPQTQRLGQRREICIPTEATPRT